MHTHTLDNIGEKRISATYGLHGSIFGYKSSASRSTQLQLGL